MGKKRHKTTFSDLIIAPSGFSNDKTMDRKDIERLTKIETKLDHIQESNTEIREILKEIKNKQAEYVKHDDDSYFNRYMSKYNTDNLQKKTNWLTCVDIVFKLTLVFLSGHVVYYWTRLNLH